MEPPPSPIIFTIISFGIAANSSHQYPNSLSTANSPFTSHNFTSSTFSTSPTIPATIKRPPIAPVTQWKTLRFGRTSNGPCHPIVLQSSEYVTPEFFSVTYIFSPVTVAESHVEAEESLRIAGIDWQRVHARDSVSYASTARGSSSNSHAPPATTMSGPTRATIGSVRLTRGGHA